MPPVVLHSFGPGDITCVAVVPGKAYVLDEVTDFSISSHFDQIPVRRLGHRLPVGWATGSGSVAGTLVCAQFTQGALWKLRRHAAAARLLGDRMLTASTEEARRRLEYYTAGILPQQLPPFHLIFLHTNQDGLMAMARLYHVVLSDHGEVKGAHNAFTEETLQFQALYYEPIRLHRAMTTDQLLKLVGKTSGFFNDPRLPEMVSEELLLPELAATTDLERRGYDYILSESQRVADRLAGGGSSAETATSIALADRGHIVWVDGVSQLSGPVAQTLEDLVPVEEGLPGEPPPPLPAAAAPVIVEIADSILLGVAGEMATGTASVVIQGSTVYLLPETELAALSPQDLQERLATAAQSVGTILDDRIVARFTDEVYVSNLRLDERPHPGLMATTAELSVALDGSSVRRTRSFTDRATLRELEGTELERYAGTYRLVDAIVNGLLHEEYTLDVVDDELTVTAAQIGPWDTVTGFSGFNDQLVGTLYMQSSSIAEYADRGFQIRLVAAPGQEVRLIREPFRATEWAPVGGIEDTVQTVIGSGGSGRVALLLPPAFHEPNVALMLTRKPVGRLEEQAEVRVRTPFTRDVPFTLEMRGFVWRPRNPVMVAPWLRLSKESTLEEDTMTGRVVWTPRFEFSQNYRTTATNMRAVLPSTARYFEGSYHGSTLQLQLSADGTEVLSGSYEGTWQFSAGVPVTTSFELVPDSGLHLDVDTPVADTLSVRLLYPERDITTP